LVDLRQTKTTVISGPFCLFVRYLS